MVPFKTDRMLIVGCSNLDDGLAVKAVCPIGCIGCSVCARKSELVTMEGKLPVIDYDAYDNEASFAASVEKCPRESLVFVGKPTAEDLAKTEDEEVPERIEADFHTTVDDTSWRG